MTKAHLIADSLVTLAAIAGLLVLFGVLRRSGPADAMTGRFQLGLIVLIVFLTGRLLWWITDSSIFMPVMFVSAGLIPLATIVLAEGLLRRHAPPIVKYGLLVATAVFVVVAFLPIALVEPVRSYALLAFQFAGFLAAGWMILNRDRTSLSPRENWLTDRIALSLLLILPFLVTDFRFDGSQLPVRMAGIAILFICWLSVGMGRSSLGHRDTIKAFAVLVASAIVAGIGIGMIATLDFAFMVQSVALVLSASLIAAIFIDAMNLGAEERRDSLLNHIAHGSETDAAAFLQGLREHMLVEGALMLGAGDLSEFDADELRIIFATDPVRNIAEARKQASSMQPELQQLQALFERYDVTHIMLVAREPLTLVALNMPALAATPGAETELRAAQRVALLISEQAHGRD